LLGAVTCFVVARLIRANERGIASLRSNDPNDSQADRSASELAEQAAHG
jgi:hypothetical protein